MATLISRTTGNFTTSTTWGVASPVAELDSETGTTTVTTGTHDSATFVLENVSVDGIAVKLAQVGATTGTISFTLRNSTTSTNVQTVTINVADLDDGSVSASSFGWYVFPISSHTPNGTHSYLIRITSSAGGSVQLYTNGSASNWSRQVRKTTQAAPAANDKLIIAGEHTGAGAGTSFTVTMNNTATTTFGQSTPTFLQSISVSKRASLIWGTSMTTNYYLKWNGVFVVNPGGTVSVGTSGSPIHSTSTAVLEMNSASDGEGKLLITAGGLFNAYGAEKDIVTTQLNANHSAGATVLNVTNATGWAIGDEVCIASTTQTRTECEKVDIINVISPSQCSLGTPLTYAHGGISPVVAEVGNLTRNVKIRSVSSSAKGIITFHTTSNFYAEYIEFYKIMGITTPDISSGEFTIAYCSIYESNVGFQSDSTDFTGDGGLQSGEITECVIFNITNGGIAINGAISGIFEITSNLVMLTGSYGIRLFDCDSALANNSAVGCTNAGIQFTEPNFTGTLACTNNTTHSNAGYGIHVSLFMKIVSGVLDVGSCWRNSSGGVILDSFARDLTISGVNIFGNFAINVSLGVAADNVLIKDLVIFGEASFPTVIGIIIHGSPNNLVIQYCNFFLHSTIDVLVGTSADGKVVLHNCVMNSSLTYVGFNSDAQLMIVASQMHNGVAGDHRVFKGNGVTRTDTQFYVTASPSVRMTPSFASFDDRMTSIGINGGFLVPVTSGVPKTLSVAIRKSVLADGAAYNGTAQPRLMVKEDTSLGITSNTVVATATNAANGAFEIISGTSPTPTDDGVMEVYIDCNGNAGWLNFDNFTVSG